MTEEEIEAFTDEIMEQVSEKADDTSLPWETSAEIYESIASECVMRANTIRGEHE